MTSGPYFATTSTPRPARRQGFVLIKKSGAPSRGLTSWLRGLRGGCSVRTTFPTTKTTPAACHSQPPDCTVHPDCGVGGECFCTSRMYSTSRTSGPYIRVWEGVAPHASGGPVVVVRFFFRPAGAGKEPGAARTPRSFGFGIGGWPTEINFAK
jgi:hypothetical protein